MARIVRPAVAQPADVVRLQERLAVRKAVGKKRARMTDADVVARLFYVMVPYNKCDLDSFLRPRC